MATTIIKEKMRTDMTMEQTVGMLRFFKTVFDDVNIDNQIRIVLRFADCTEEQPSLEYRFWKLFYACFGYLFASEGGEVVYEGVKDGTPEQTSAAVSSGGEGASHTLPGDPDRADPTEGME